MRSVLISIRPEWVEKIILKEKTIEVRKTRPKIKPPFKCYIYCSKGRSKADQLERLELLPDCHWKRLDGKVVAEFTCYNIHKVNPSALLPKDFESRTCMDSDQIWDYLRGQGWAWGISDLKVYDSPLELSALTSLRQTESGHEPIAIKRAPQSWCYVERVDE